MNLMSLSPRAVVRDMKQCTLCLETKPLEDFNKRKRGADGRQPRCRACQKIEARQHRASNIGYYREKNANHRNEIRAQFVQWLHDHPCVDCGEDDLVVLECDHVGAKRAAIGTMINRNCSWSAIMAELTQCEVRCANCHRRQTAKRHGGWLRDLADLHEGRRML